MSITKSATRLHPLEFRLFKALGASMRGEKVLVACSGGCDSVALTSLLAKLAPRLGFVLLGLAYVHHGPSPSKKISNYRSAARKRVEQLASELGTEFFALEPSRKSLSSEAELREFRLQALQTCARELGASAIAFAHHADDLFETRVIRLMRGTGARGLEAMTERKGLTWRPLLRETSDAIRAYASDQSLEWIDDPSNRDSTPLRNWIRGELVPFVERKRPGAVRAMARSFDLICEELSTEWSVGAKLDRPLYEEARRIDRKRLISSYALDQGAKITSKQVEEILKRLSSFESQRRKAGTFVVAGLAWNVSPSEIVATPVSAT